MTRANPPAMLLLIMELRFHRRRSVPKWTGSGLTRTLLSAAAQFRYEVGMIFRILLFLALLAAGVATFFFLWQLAEGPYDGIGLFFFGMILIWCLIAGVLAL